MDNGEKWGIVVDGRINPLTRLIHALPPTEGGRQTALIKNRKLNG